MVRPDCDDYFHLFLNDIPFIDVRAPVEFAQGAFPHAINLPILNDQERAKIGTCYKHHGQNAAIALGHKLVQGDKKQTRIDAWLAACNAHPDGYIYCFRGGLRSQLAQQWLLNAGLAYPRVIKGYKALRTFLISAFNQYIQLPATVVSGHTGSGKTLLINELKSGIDLEGHAHHRGSSFGRTLRSQPSQIDFENTLTIDLLKKHHAGINAWVLEDEGHAIGANHLPVELYNTITRSPIVVIEDPFEIRLQRLEKEYIHAMWQGFIARDGKDLGWQNYGDYLRSGLFAIRKRLGMERFQELTNLLNHALTQQAHSGDQSAHRSWLTPLLTHYYDPMYRYQLEKKQNRIIFRGEYSEVRDFLKNQEHNAIR